MMIVFHLRCRLMPINSSHKPDPLSGAELLDPPGGEKLRLHFSGPFEGNEVHWNATLFTPAAWASAWGEGPPQKNIIEIGDKGDDGITLNICLKVANIDQPTVRKAMMMVRQYKRLQRGRHEYG